MYSQSYARVCLFRSDCGRICLGFWGTKKNDNKHKEKKKEGFRQPHTFKGRLPPPFKATLEPRKFSISPHL